MNAGTGNPSGDTIRVPDGIAYSGIPSPFAWWLFLPAYLFSLIYFAARVQETIRAGSGDAPSKIP